MEEDPKPPRDTRRKSSSHTVYTLFPKPSHSLCCLGIKWRVGGNSQHTQCFQIWPQIPTDCPDPCGFYPLARTVHILYGTWSPALPYPYDGPSFKAEMMCRAVMRLWRNPCEDGANLRVNLRLMGRGGPVVMRPSSNSRKEGSLHWWRSARNQSVTRRCAVAISADEIYACKLFDRHNGAAKHNCFQTNQEIVNYNDLQIIWSSQWSSKTQL